MTGDAALAVWVALGGGVGAALRYVVDVAVGSRWRGRFPLAIFLVNVSGSLALGLVLGVWSGGVWAGGVWSGGMWSIGAAAGGVPLPAALLGTGVLGGYTTFSTASHDTVSLVREGRIGMALAYAVGTLVITTAAAGLGLWLGSLLGL